MTTFISRGLPRFIATAVVGIGALLVAGAVPAGAATAPAATAPAVTASVATAPAAVVAAAPAAPTCATVPWGSKVKKHKVRSFTSATIRNIRAASHTCYDRVVIDLGPGKKTGYRVEYVDAVVQDGSGFEVPLAGKAQLQVTVMAAAYNPNTGKPTYSPKKWKKVVNTKGFKTVKQVAFAGSFEGQSTVGIGVRARLPFKVSVLKGPGQHQRLVIDIARNW